MRYAEASFWGDSAAIVLTSARATVHVSYAGVSFSRLGLEPCPGILFAIRMKGPHVDIGNGRIHGVYDLTHPAGRPDDSVALTFSMAESFIETRPLCMKIEGSKPPKCVMRLRSRTLSCSAR